VERRRLCWQSHIDGRHAPRALPSFARSHAFTLSQQKTYVCTSDAVRSKLCTSEHLGEFIVNLPASIPLNKSSIWTSRIAFDSKGSSPSGGLWDNPNGNPKLPPSKLGPTNIRARAAPTLISYPITYPVPRSGYYCVGAYLPQCSLRTL
jgi:hypothetical protein